MISYDTVLNYRLEHGLSDEEFLILYLVKTQDIERTKQYIEINGKFSGELIENLEKEGWLMNLNQGNDIVFSNLVAKNFLTFLDDADSDIATEVELIYDEYPAYIVVDSKNIASQNLSKSELLEQYKRITKQYPKVTTPIMLKLLKYAKARKLINCGMRKFFENDQFVSVLKHQEQSGENKFDNEY